MKWIQWLVRVRNAPTAPTVSQEFVRQFEAWWVREGRLIQRRHPRQQLALSGPTIKGSEMKMTVEFDQPAAILLALTLRPSDGSHEVLIYFGLAGRNLPMRISWPMTRDHWDQITAECSKP